MTQQEILEVIVKALDSKRAEDIQVLHVGELTILGDYFIIANGTCRRRFSMRQTRCCPPANRC